MAFEIPKWTAHAVREWEALLVETQDGHADLNAATEALLNYMPAIGITTLNDASAADAWCRIAIHQALFGSFNEDTKTGQPIFLTKSDVLRHIGLETEGTQQSFEEFCSGIHWRAQHQGESQLPSFVANGSMSFLRLLGLAESEDAPSSNE